ncbi:MAG: hypothetical protein AABX07_02695 [Nanoarchaeota archaeon]
MSNQLQGMRKAEVKEIRSFEIDFFPEVTYDGRKINAAAFGPAAYNSNVNRIKTTSLNEMPLRELTTTESLAVASYNFTNFAKPLIFNPSWLQAGYVLRDVEGVWINPLRDTNGNVIMDGKALESRLNNLKKANGIYLFDKDTSFVPYDSFKQGVQEHETFLEGGLARGLVHTSDKKAITLSSVANNIEYHKGVNVFGFDSVTKPVLRVVCLDSDRLVDGGRLNVDGSWSDGYGGYALGGLVSGEASEAKNSEVQR